MDNKKEFFDVISLSREDFNEVGYNADKLTDAQMERIAKRISEVCMEYFWASLEWWGENLDLPEFKE
jgi:hypothetical protein